MISNYLNKLSVLRTIKCFVAIDAQELRWRSMPSTKNVSSEKNFHQVRVVMIHSTFDISNKPGETESTHIKQP